ncbi:MutS-related protein [Dysgonomonas reticulitermitis]
MKFEVDKQTLKDLEIFGLNKADKTVFNLFNHTQCIGGRNRLYEILRNPLSDYEKIEERKDAIAFFQKHLPSGLDVDKDALDFSEYYLRHSGRVQRPPTRIAAIERKIIGKITSSNDYYLVEKGVESLVNLLKGFYKFSQQLAEKLKIADCPALLLRNNDEILRLFEQLEFDRVKDSKKLSAYDTARFDYLFRYTNRKDVLFILDMVYEYDAFLSVVKTAELYDLIYPEIVPETENVLDIEDLKHLFVDEAVGNDVHFDRSANLLFISGPNMAGKSTFLKALGVAVYLAHAGLPVPAKRMKLNVLSGLCTTINISDNLSSGYSHFYAEVMRIKDVATRLKTNKNMLVLFDELFRGTNVKDAYDGTLAIVSAFAQIKTSFFVISSHIVEVTNELQGEDNIKFSYFEIEQQNGHPVYTYKLKDGVTDVRLGMYIIQKEGVIELINEINKSI